MLSINWTILVQFAGFIFLILFLKKHFWSPMLALIEKRQGEIEGRLEQAKHIRTEGEKKLQSYEAAINAAKREVVELLANAQREGARRQQEILDEARAEASRMIAEAHQQVEEAVQAARQKLLVDANRLAREVVEKILGRPLAA